MIKRQTTLCCLLFGSAASLLADFSYEQTSKVTGGMMAGMMKVAGVFSKTAREPIRSTVLVKGDRMAHVNENSGSIMDLASETITHVDFRAKTYSVITFAQMKEAMEKAMQKMGEQKDSDVRFKASVKETGQRKQISGYDCKEVILTLEMEGTNQKTGDTGALNVTSDMWLAPRVAGYDEVKNFYLRMAKKIDWTPGGGAMAMGRSDMAKAMTDLQKEAAKLDGIAVLQIVRMGGSGQPGQAPPSQPSAGQKEQPAPSVSDAIGSSLGRLGGLRGLGRKKKKEEPQPEQPAQAPPETEAAQAAPGMLMEMTSEMTGFSSGPVDASKLQVPAGFKQVESPMAKGLMKQK